MPDTVQELTARLAQKRQQIADVLARIRNIELAIQVRASGPPSFADIAAQKLGGTAEQFQASGPPGRPVTTSGGRRDAATWQNEPILGLPSRAAERLGATPVKAALSLISNVPGPIGDVAGRGAEEIGRRVDLQRTAREEVSPPAWQQVTGELADVGLDIGLLGRTPGLGKALLGTERAVATGRGALPAAARIAQGLGAEAARGAGIETALGAIEGAPIDEITHRQQMGALVGAPFGVVMAGAGEVARLRGRLQQTRQRIADVNKRIERLQQSRAARERGEHVGARLEQAETYSLLEREADRIAPEAISEVNAIEAGQGLSERASMRETDEIQRGVEAARDRARAQARQKKDWVGRGLEGRAAIREQNIAEAEAADVINARRSMRAAERESAAAAAERNRQQVTRAASDLQEQIGEVAVREQRRQELPGSMRRMFDRINTQRGGVTPALVEPLASSGTGAAVGGAQSDDDHRWRDIAIGGFAGLGLALGGRRVARSVTARHEANRLAGLAPHSRRIQQQIKSGMGETTLPTLNDIYSNLVRRQAGIESAERALAGGAPVPSMSSPTVAAELATGSARRAEGALTIGVPRWTPDGNIEIVGDSFEDILSPLKGKVNEFERYELAARTAEVGKRDIQTGISLDDALLEVNGASPIVRQAHERAVQFRRNVLQYWADAGGVSPEALQAMDELGQHYVPLRRVFDGRDPLLGTGRIGNVAQQLKRLGGSKRAIVSPIESTIDQTNRLVRAADMNRVSLRLIELAETNPEAAAGLIMRDSEGVSRTVGSRAKLLQRAAERRGMNISDDVATELAAALGDDKTLTVADDILRVWRNGKREQWRLAPGLAKGIRAMGPQQVELWVRLVGAPAQALKSGVTLNPAFQAFNFIRDTFDATLQSQYGFRLGIDSFKGFYESAKGSWLNKPSEAYKGFVLGGGGFSSFRGGRTQTLKQQKRAVVPRSLAAKVASKVVHPLDALKEFGAPFEEAARMGEYLRARESQASVAESVLASKKVTVDFQQIGASMQALAHMTAFLNPAIQSLDTMMRVVARPVTKAVAVSRAGASAGKVAGTAAGEAARVYGTAIGALSIPSALLWAANKNDQDIQDLRKTNAGLIYWFFRKPTGGIGRIPKPFMWGQIFATGMESALDRFYADDPAAGQRFVDGVLEQASAQVLPTALQTYVEQKANKDSFFGTPIVPPERTDLSPRFQYTPRTGTIARAVGDRYNVSPARIEAVWRDVTGSLGSNALQLLDRVADRIGGGEDISMAPVPADNVLWGRFTARFPTTNVEPLQTFYAEHARIATLANDIADQEKVHPERALALVQSHPVDFALIPIYEASRQKMAEIRADMEFIRQQPASVIDKTEKRRVIDELTLGLVEVARNVNNAVAKFRAQGDTSMGRP